MTDVTGIELTATPAVALSKLKRQNIPVYKLKKRGARLYFGVKTEYIEKVFAIFAHPCYNIRIVSKSRSMRFTAFLKRRAGLTLGAVLFCAAILFSQLAVLKIKITGSGGYLKPQVIKIAEECGVRQGRVCTKIDKPLLEAKVLALGGVSFCSVQRAGAYLIIDVQAEKVGSSNTGASKLTASESGVITRIVAVCGTPLKNEGDAVSKGEKLIEASVAEGGGNYPLAVGFAEICVSKTLSLAYDSESEQNTKSALASPSLYSDRVIEKSYKVRKGEQGVTYEVTFTYLVTCAVNMQ